MTIQDREFLTNWQERFEDETQWDWFCGIESRVDCEDPWVREQLRCILERIQNIVGKITEENGAQSTVRYKEPHEVANEIKVFAEILILGELEAAVFGEPDEAGEKWAVLLKNVWPLLDGFVNAKEVTSGASSLSRRRHAEKAIEYLFEVEITSEYNKSQISEKEKLWLHEALSGVAHAAFQAGRLTTMAENKIVEVDAVRGSKVAGGARNSANQINQKHVEPRNMRLDRMKELCLSMAVTTAAKTCEKEGLGSAKAIMKTWYRHKKKCDT